MPFYFSFKSTVLWLSFCFVACGQQQGQNHDGKNQNPPKAQKQIREGAQRTSAYLPLLRDKKIAVVANQTSVIFTKNQRHTHLVDSLLAHGITITKVFAPEHGFRGRADAGEHVKDGVDSKTGLPIISLYGKNRKPTQAQLQDLELLVFDIQDVGVRFYTYIATLQLVMEACAEAKIPLILLDRPNPNGHYVDGPTMETEHSSFLGMNEIPLVYGMTIGEYAKMVNGEGWLAHGMRADLTVITLEDYTHDSSYSLPIRPSPNLPNYLAINLYPSLGLFEGTTVNAGRGTEHQFQRYGASFLDSTQYDFSYVPQPNFGAKHPKEEGKMCFGKDLADHGRMDSISLRWLMDAYAHCTKKPKFFMTSGFTKHAGTQKLQQQIESGWSEADIRATWKPDLDKFNAIRKQYLIYN